MNRKSLSLTIIVIIIVGISAYAALKRPWRTYHDLEYGFSIRYPMDWKIVENGYGKSNVLFTSSAGSYLTISPQGESGPPGRPLYQVASPSSIRTIMINNVEVKLSEYAVNQTSDDKVLVIAKFKSYPRSWSLSHKILIRAYANDLETANTMLRSIRFTK